jgi:catechol 2,3-dioxygenase-like lactoylglutathione lyase family enzyme
MRTTHDVFHLAIPVHDLDAAQHFYVTLLGCKLARRYPDRITLDFFGDQLVCHLTEGDVLGERPVAYVVPAGSWSPDKLEYALREAGLPRARRPSAFLVVDQMPLGPTGKIARRRLRELAATAPAQHTTGR